MGDSRRFAVKLQHGEDIRRIQLEPEPSFDELQRLVGEVFPGLGAAVLKYKDEEDDFITISCDSELTEAFHCSASPLRIWVFASDKPATTSTATTPSPAPSSAEKPRSRSVSADPPVPTPVPTPAQPSMSSSQSGCPFDLGSLLSAFAAPPTPTPQPQQQQQANPLASLLPLLGMLQGGGQQSESLVSLLPIILGFVKDNPQALGLAMQLLATLNQPTTQSQQQQAPQLDLGSLLSAFMAPQPQQPQQPQQQQQQQQVPPIFNLAAQFLGNLQQQSAAAAQPQQQQQSTRNVSTPEWWSAPRSEEAPSSEAKTESAPAATTTSTSTSTSSGDATVQLPSPYNNLPPYTPPASGSTVELPPFDINPTKPAEEVPSTTEPSSTATKPETAEPTVTVPLTIPSPYNNLPPYTPPATGAVVTLPPFDINPTKPAEQSPATATATPTATTSGNDYTAELAQLSAMGFVNETENLRLLRLHDGDVSMVVQVLTATSDFFMP